LITLWKSRNTLFSLSQILEKKIAKLICFTLLANHGKQVAPNDSDLLQ
jgi:hypothetical protein